MSKRIALIATLLFALAAMPAFGAKGGGKPATATTPPIVLNQSAPVTGSQVTFTVTRTSVQIGQVLYVRNDCFDAAGSQAAYGLSLVYFDPTSPNNSVGTTNPFTVAGVSCTAYVTDSPSTGHAISKDAQITFAVASP